MTRIGNLYGPSATFLGVPAADLDVPSSWNPRRRSSLARPSMGALRIAREVASAPSPFAPLII